jgi:hypothetical protein
MTDTSIHLFDAADPDEDQTFLVTVYSDVVPRVGDFIVYWVDWPTHMQDSINPEPGEPMRVAGTVSRVTIDYRHMRGWGPSENLHTLVSVYLTDYRATRFPHDKS